MGVELRGIKRLWGKKRKKPYQGLGSVGQFSFSYYFENLVNPIIKRKVLGRKTATNLDSILKSRDITLPTKVHIAKAMVFPGVMYGCESWTIKKAECQRIDPFKLRCWRKHLRVP